MALVRVVKSLAINLSNSGHIMGCAHTAFYFKRIEAELDELRDLINKLELFSRKQKAMMIIFAAELGALAAVAGMATQ